MKTSSWMGNSLVMCLGLMAVPQAVAAQAATPKSDSGQYSDRGQDVVAGENERVPGAIYFGTRNYVGGQIGEGGAASEVSWKNDSFDGPFHFAIDAVSEISFQQKIGDVADKGEFGVELVNGDLLFGSIDAIEDGRLVIDSPLLGTQAVATDLVRRIFRWSGGKAQLFNGPGQLDSWKNSSDRDGWSGVGGQIATKKSLTSLYRNVGLSERCRIELEVSWEKKPNFVISIGTDETAKSATEAYRIEFWGSAIVMLREAGQAAKVTSLGTVEKAAGRLRLAIELDQVRQRAIIYSDRGARLGQIDFQSTDGKPLPGIQLENIHGDFRLHTLRVLQGAGSGDAEEELLGAELRAIDNGQLVFGVADQESRIGLDTLTAIRFENLDADAKPAETDDPIGFQLITHGSTQLSGTMVSITGSELTIQPTYLDQPVVVPTGELRSLRAVKQETAAPATQGRQGLLELSDTSILGSLMDSENKEGTSCLRFHPIHSSNAANLLVGANGRVVYRERDANPGAKETAPQPRRNRGGFLGAVVGALAGNNGNVDSTSNRYLHLRSGDAVEAKVVSINEEAVLIDSLVTGEKWIQQSEIKAVELRGPDAIPTLDEAKRARLLSVPRMRKATPPKHLLISTNGDFLKGNLISLDDQQAVVENRLETITIPRRLISRIIWFHPEETDPEQTGTEQAGTEQTSTEKTNSEEASTEDSDVDPTASPAGMRIQAIHANGVRLTFDSEQVGDGELVGTSAVLGACLVNVKTIDQLLFGAMIESSNDQLPYNQWKLANAPEPKVLQAGSDGSGGMRNSGTSSPLVGQPAPDFQLELLDGQPFRISEQKGQVVVLDFWATWCGPCIQAMPMIDEAVHRFAGEDVVLVAVNLQESPDQIRSTLERLKLNPTVALDIDGVAAARYQANAIPQTVVINRAGEVTHVFVGGGGGLGDSLADAIRGALEMKPASEVESP